MFSDQLPTCTAVVSPYMRKRNEGGPRGAFSAQMENFFLLSLSSYSPGFVTSDSGSSSPLLDPAPPPPTPLPSLARTLLLVLFLDMFFCCSGYIFVRPEHKEALWFSAGCWAASKSSRLASTYWRFPLRSRTFCSTVELWERLSE